MHLIFVFSLLLLFAISQVHAEEICGAQGQCEWNVVNATCCAWNGRRINYEERQNIPSHGSKRRLEDLLCACEPEDEEYSRGGNYQAGMVVVSIFAMVTLLSVLLWYFAKSMRNSPSRLLEEAELQRIRENELRDRERSQEQIILDINISKSKAALITVPSTQFCEEARCPICLEKLSEFIIRPPNCTHEYHRHCLEDWIDRAKANKFERALACPICNLPFLTSEEAAGTQNYRPTHSLQQENHQAPSSPLSSSTSSSSHEQSTITAAEESKNEEQSSLNNLGDIELGNSMQNVNDSHEFRYDEFEEDRMSRLQHPNTQQEASGTYDPIQSLPAPSSSTTTPNSF